MNLKRYLIATFALFVFIFLYEWLVHDIILMGMYKDTQNVWRDFSEMNAQLPLGMCVQFVLSAWAAFAFSKLYKDGGIKNGLRFGLFFGVFGAILTSSWYLWLPVPLKLGMSWFINGIVEGLGGGYILGLVYRMKQIIRIDKFNH